jgi:hypothetical protein
MRFGRAAFAATALVATLLPALAADSGPKVGSSVTKFEVQDITGRNKGKTVCYV